MDTGLQPAAKLDGLTDSGPFCHSSAGSVAFPIGTFRTLTDRIVSLPESQHLSNHLVPLGYRVPSHLGPLGNGTVIRLVGVNFHILPDLPLLLGEFLR